MTDSLIDNCAIDAYMRHCESIRVKLAALAAQCDDFFGQSPDDIDWGHVGDIARIDSQLSKITAE